MSLRGSVARRALRLTGVKRRFRSADATRARVAKVTRRPPRSEPSRVLRRGLVVERRVAAGMPVYRIGPRDRATDRRVVYLHGGGYVEEISQAHWAFIRHLARRVPATVEVPIYPLAPGATASTTVPAVTAVVRVLLDDDPVRPLILMGDSAGGGMALAVAQRLRATGAEPAAAILLSPWLDVTMSEARQRDIEPDDPLLAIAGGVEAGRMYAGDLDRRDPLVSPLFGPLDRLPPLTVLTGTSDILNVDARRLAERCRAVTQPCEVLEEPRMTHVWMFLPFVPEARAARAAIVARCRGARRP